MFKTYDMCKHKIRNTFWRTSTSTFLLHNWIHNQSAWASDIVGHSYQFVTPHFRWRSTHHWLDTCWWALMMNEWYEVWKSFITLRKNKSNNMTDSSRLFWLPFFHPSAFPTESHWKTSLDRMYTYEIHILFKFLINSTKIINYDFVHTFWSHGWTYP